MLVLTRKLNEQILIGDDIKITLTRVTGNTVRLGIEAPRDVRIVRGELGPLADSDESVLGGGPQISACEEPFAHPASSTEKRPTVNRIKKEIAEPQLFVGSVKTDGSGAKLTRAPLANFVARTAATEIECC